MKQPHLLSTSYRCLQCQKAFKKIEKELHLNEFPMHEIYKIKQEQEWNSEDVPHLRHQELIIENEKLKKEFESENKKLQTLQRGIRILKEYFNEYTG